MKHRLFYISDNYAFIIMGKCAYRTMEYIFKEELKWKKHFKSVNNKEFIAIVTSC